MNQETTAVATTGQRAVGTVIKTFNDEMAVRSENLLLAKVLLMQGLSKLVADDKAKQGEIRNSLTGQILAKKGEGCEVIFFAPSENWIIFENEKYVRTVPLTDENVNWEWQEGTITRQKCLNYLVLLPQDIAKNEPFPMQITFKSTGYKCGRKVESERTRLAMFKKRIFSKVYKLTSEFKENEQGKFYVPDITEARDATKTEIEAVATWMDRIKTTNIEVDDSDLKGKEATTATAEVSREY